MRNIFGYFLTITAWLLANRPERSQGGFGLIQRLIDTFKFRLVIRRPTCCATKEQGLSLGTLLRP